MELDWHRVLRNATQNGVFKSQLECERRRL